MTTSERWARSAYTMTVSCSIRLGTPQDIEIEKWTRYTFSPDSMVTNARCPGFVTLSLVTVDIVNVLFPETECDAWDFRPGKVLQDFDHQTLEEIQEAKDSYRRCSFRDRLPDLICVHGVDVVGRYTGLVPPNYREGDTVTFSVSFRGVAKISLGKY